MIRGEKFLMRYIESYVHKNRVGVLLELEADSDSAEESDEFRQLARDLVLQVAAGKAKSPSELLERRFIRTKNSRCPTEFMLSRRCSTRRFG